MLLGIAQGTAIYFEAALIIAMLGFVSPLPMRGSSCGGISSNDLDIIATYAVGPACCRRGLCPGRRRLVCLKFNDPMTRLHAPTKVGTVGIGALLLAAMIHSYFIGEGVAA